MIVRILVGSILLAIGFLLGVYASPLQTVPDNTSFRFDRVVNVAALLATLTPLLVGFVVAFYFKRPSDQRHAIKQTLITKINRVDSDLESLAGLSRIDKLPYSQAASASKRCTVAIKMIFDNLNMYDIKVKDQLAIKRSLDVCIYTLRKPLTDQPSTGAEDCKRDLVVEDGICKYSLSRISAIETHVEEVRAELLSLVLSIQGCN